MEKYLINPAWEQAQKNYSSYLNQVNRLPMFMQHTFPSYNEWSYNVLGPTPQQLYQRQMSEIPMFAQPSRAISFDKWFSGRSDSFGNADPGVPLGPDWLSKGYGQPNSPFPSSGGASNPLLGRSTQPNLPAGPMPSSPGVGASQPQWSVQTVEEKADPAVSESYWNKQRTAFQNLIAGITPGTNTAFRNAFMAIPEATRSANPLMQVLAARFGPTTGV